MWLEEEGMATASRSTQSEPCLAWLFCIHAGNTKGHTQEVVSGAAAAASDSMEDTSFFTAIPAGGAPAIANRPDREVARLELEPDSRELDLSPPPEDVAAVAAVDFADFGFTTFTALFCSLMAAVCWERLEAEPPLLEVVAALLLAPLALLLHAPLPLTLPL